MKTTKKGFTLIELIVVIAIIGVLAAILVPSMLGYVRKSKISSANSTASSVYKAINSALTELDEEGCDVGGDYILTWNGSVWSTTGSKPKNIGEAKGGLLDSKIANFFNDISKVKNAKAQIHSGSCIALASCSDSTYTGTYPGGLVTNETYDTEKFKPSSGEVPDTALTAAIEAAGYTGSGASVSKKENAGG